MPTTSNRIPWIIHTIATIKARGGQDSTFEIPIIPAM